MAATKGGKEMRFGMLRRLGLLLAVLAMVTAGCAGDDDGGGGGESAGEPVKGGTLRIVNEEDVDFWDTGSAYTVTAWAFARLHVRTLYSFDSSKSAEEANEPVPDIAAGPPTVSDDRLTYTFKLRPNVRYAPPVNRAVKAEDFIYAVERQFDKKYPSPNPYNSVFKGAEEFADGKADSISGLKAVDDNTLEITLAQPASDFLSIMATNFYAPVPEEYASKYKPQTDYSKVYRGAGPYYLQQWTQDKSATFVRNPNWDQASDPLRKAYVDKVEVRLGVDPNAAQQQIESGDADLSVDNEPPQVDLQRLANDPTLSKQFIAPADGCIRYLTLQTDSGPTAKLQVRQAINYAVDKDAVVRAVGGRIAADPATTILTPPLLGYQKYDLYPTPNNRGDTAKAKELLTKAGYPNGVTLTYVSDTSGQGPRILTSVQESLSRAGIKIKVKALNYPAIYTDNLQLTSKKDEHQIGQAAWCPDYPGNGARSFMGVLLDGRKIVPQGNNNYGDYNSPKTNQLIDQALAATDTDAAGAAWTAADKQAMTDAAWVPLTYDKRGKFWSSRVKNYKYTYWVTNADFANLWLNPNTP
jgi:peptide/nickel transport system substrate-binding protein